MNKPHTYYYRSKDGSSVVTREYDFFDDEPQTITENNIKHYKFPQSAEAGWTHMHYESDDGKHVIEEFWKHGAAPESFVRDGIEYRMKFGIPTRMESHRTGNGLLSKCDKSFQDLMKNVAKRSNSKTLKDRL